MLFNQHERQALINKDPLAPFLRYEIERFRVLRYFDREIWKIIKKLDEVIAQARKCSLLPKR